MLDTPDSMTLQPKKKESGKAGLALLGWILGVPGSLILLYLIFF